MEELSKYYDCIKSLEKIRNDFGRMMLLTPYSDTKYSLQKDRDTLEKAIQLLQEAEGKELREDARGRF